ncbi:MAG: hypothetical protein ACOH2F_03540 [Cellulomonas sp.]
MSARTVFGRIRFHRVGCRVDGGTGRHGARGFRCPKCSQLDGDGYLDGLLKKLDDYAGGR